MDIMTVAPANGMVADCTPAGTIPFKCVAVCNDGFGFPGLVARVGSGMVQPGTLGTITATCTNGVQWDRTWFPDCERRCTLPTTVPDGAIVDCDPELNPVMANARFASTCTVQCPEGETFGGAAISTDLGISRIDYVCNAGVLELGTTFQATPPNPIPACG